MKKYNKSFCKSKRTHFSEKERREARWIVTGMNIIKELGYKPENIDDLIAEKLNFTNPFKK